MKNYTVIKASTIDILQTEVKEHLANGWVCQGGVCQGEFDFYQALVHTLEWPIMGGLNKKEFERWLEYLKRKKLEEQL